MKRWLLQFKTPLLVLALCLMGAACLLPGVAEAQGLAKRDFPPKALRGLLEVTAPPNILLDRKPRRLSPGARIKDTKNLIVMSASLVGKELLVNYVADPQGLIHEVWILTPTEVQQKRAGLETLTNIRFGSDLDRTARHPEPAASQ
ncbi:hypothetical protein [Rhodoferax sp. BLA1]|uniref:hypothetical protein n=1 Tax=Rhodoferax sp. BLA1 TaxID=2576062 RepID=UPI00210299E7|nr:hypothetical protein [Rhodoferax sp. BLA1]